MVESLRVVRGQLSTLIRDVETGTLSNAEAKMRHAQVTAQLAELDGFDDLESAPAGEPVTGPEPTE